MKYNARQNISLSSIKKNGEEVAKEIRRRMVESIIGEFLKSHKAETTLKITASFKHRLFDSQCRLFLNQQEYDEMKKFLSEHELEKRDTMIFEEVIDLEMEITDETEEPSK